MKRFFLCLWAILLILVVVYWHGSGLSAVDVQVVLENWLTDLGLFYAALLYIVIYSIRPLVFFPAAILAMSSGVLFGPVLGVIFTTIGENFSANIAFFVSRSLGRTFVKDHETNALEKWDTNIANNAFLSVLIMRLIYLPFDCISYACGLTGMKQRHFALGTLIGSFPGTIVFVLLGGAAATPAHRTFILSLSLGLFVLCLVVAKFLRRSRYVQ